MNIPDRELAVPLPLRMRQSTRRRKNRSIDPAMSRRWHLYLFAGLMAVAGMVAVYVMVR